MHSYKIWSHFFGFFFSRSPIPSEWSHCKKTKMRKNELWCSQTQFECVYHWRLNWIRVKTVAAELSSSLQIHTHRSARYQSHSLLPLAHNKMRKCPIIMNSYTSSYKLNIAQTIRYTYSTNNSFSMLSKRSPNNTNGNIIELFISSYILRYLCAVCVCENDCVSEARIFSHFNIK